MFVFDIRDIFNHGKHDAHDDRDDHDVMRVHDFIRTRVPEFEHDRPPSPDLAAITELIASGDVERACALEVN